MPAAASPSRRCPPGFDLQGHRGARGLAPENTIGGFLLALDLGVTTLEMDAVVSADGQVVVSHDPWMSAELCTHPDGRPVQPEEAATLRLFEMPYAEIARFDCGRRGHPRFPEQRPQPAIKPRLRDVIAAAEAHARRSGRALPYYNVETKSTPSGDGRLHPPPDVFTHLVAGVLRAEGVLDRSTLQSFDVRTLRAARNLAPDLALSLLVEADAANLPGDTPAAHAAALGFVPDVYSPDYHRVTPGLLRAAQDLGMRVVPWTVNEPAAMQRLAAMGVDGLITDYPNRFGPP